MHMVDSDVLIDIQRGHPPAVAWFAGLTELPSVCGLVVMELIQDAQNTNHLVDALKLIAPLCIYWPPEADQAIALSHLQAFRLSHSLGLLDALIEACAIGRGATICTFNTKHFSVVPGVTLDQPYAR